MLAICTWLWGSKYSVEDVYKLQRAVARNLNQPYRFMVMTEREREWAPPEDIERHAIKDPGLLKYKGCFARLRMFDLGWQLNRKLVSGDRLVCLDLDLIVTGPLDQLFDRPEAFVILGGGHSVNPCPYNGSVMMLKTGYYDEVWSSFSYEASMQIKYHEFPDDQAWLAHMLPKAGTWPCGRRSGIYAFMKPGWPMDNQLPENARIVAFPGARQPSDFTYLKWVRKHWK